MTTRTIIGTTLPCVRNPASFDNDFVEPTTGSLKLGSATTAASITTSPINAVAIGAGALVSGTSAASTQSIAIGKSAKTYAVPTTSYSRQLALGNSAIAKGRHSRSIGYAASSATTGNYNTTIIGAKSSTIGTQSIKIGYNIVSDQGVVFGYKSVKSINGNNLVQGYCVGGATTRSGLSFIAGAKASTISRSGHILGYNSSITNSAEQVTTVVGSGITTNSNNAIRSILIGHGTTCSTSNTFNVNVSGTGTNSLSTAFTVGTIGAGAQADPATTKVLPVTMDVAGVATAFKIQLFT
jgi:hypothetical protein